MRGGSRREQAGRRRAAVAAMAAASLALAGCQLGNAKVRRTVDITVDAKGSAGFSPLETTVQKGDRVTMVVRNRTNRVHGFSIEGYGVPAKEVTPDAPTEVVFTADREGTYQIFCQLHETHRRAALLVE